MKRERPPMPPLAVRVQVAERQAEARSNEGWRFYQAVGWHPQMHYGKRLKMLLSALGGPLQLDHDPALILRPYNPRIKDVAARYTPHAHDPEALIYREKADHQQKTTGRRPGASRTVTTKGSDIGLKTKFARLERVHKSPHGVRRRAKIPSRPFPKGRKFSKP